MNRIGSNLRLAHYLRSKASAMLVVVVVAMQACLSSWPLAGIAIAGHERGSGSIAESIAPEASLSAVGTSGDQIFECCWMHCFGNAISRSKVELEITAVSSAEFHDSAVYDALCLSRSLAGASSPEELRLELSFPVAHGFILRIRPLLM